jgi:ppGpp synthetase/RelA/SpoT-type nucleotidyltranferase
MANWVVPQVTRGQVNRAGQLLISRRIQWSRLLGSDQERQAALKMINNWRSSHSYPLHLAKKNLQTRAKRIAENATCAQRLKRLSSISVKLRRNPKMKLSQMQDIGGCRAIMPNLKSVFELVGVFETAIAKNPPRKGKDKPITRSGFELAERYDYILYPKPDGYRGYHYVFKYQSIYPKNKPYNSLRIEVQLRSIYQHYWATAVEAVSIFTEQALKTGLGRPEWKRFFALMSSAIAIRENAPIVPDTPTEPGALVHEIRQLFYELQVEMVLRGITLSIQMRDEYGAEMFLLTLDANTGRLNVTGYKPDELEKAGEDYLAAEERYVNDPRVQTVLVSVDSLNDLENAYPNYYLDTAEFLNLANRVIREDPYAVAPLL